MPVRAIYRVRPGTSGLFLLHHFFKTEKIFSARSIAGPVRFGMVRIVKFHDMEAALVHIKVDVALFKIRGVCLPDFRLRIFFLDQPPDFLTDSAAVIVLSKTV